MKSIKQKLALFAGLCRQHTAVCAALVLAAAFTGVAQAQTIPVTINVADTMSTMPPMGLGVNIGVYDSHLIDPNLAPSLKAAGITAVRLPGGSISDQYDWQHNSGINGNFVNSSDSFDDLMNTVVIPAGAQAIVTVNYGSNPAGTGGGDPAVAAAWVAHAKANNFGIKYWEIGNETYGNGFFPGNWEYDLHFLDQTAANRSGQPALSPSAYGNNALPFISDMKAQDSSIKCGVSVIGGSLFTSWNQPMLQAAGSKADFVIHHWYPGGNTAAMLAASTKIVPEMQADKAQWTSILGATKASQLQTLVTETGMGSNTGAVVALFAADTDLTWLENGAKSVDYWYIHTDILGKDNLTPGHGYYGVVMAHLLANIGDTFLNSTYNNANLRVHATQRQDGKIGVMLMNLSPSNSLTAALNISGATLSSSGTKYQFGAANYSGGNDVPTSGPSINTVSGLGNSFNVTVPAYTIVNLLIPTSTSVGGGVNSLSINFSGTGTAMDIAEFAGVVPHSHWNSEPGLSGSNVSLMDNTGATSTAKLTWNDPKSENSTTITDTAGNNRMMKNYLDASDTTATTVTVSSLPANANGYKVYVYFDGDSTETREGNYTISGAGITTTTINGVDNANTDFSGTFTAANNSAGNYVVFTIGNVSGFTLTATAVANGATFPRAPVNGIQIVPQ